jgi:ABC-2 type transport system permease protein
MPWVYHPLLAGPAYHPVTRGLNYVKGAYASSLDTLGSGTGITKTVLLATSRSSRKRDVPLYISMEEVTRQPDPVLFKEEGLAVAVLLEGEFPSFFRNYPVPGGVAMSHGEVLPRSAPTSILVVADGDLPANEVQFEQGSYRALPLGYDGYTRQTFGNLDFIMNVVNHMTDDAGLMELRSREFRIRLLNREMTSNRRTVARWTLLNTLLPLVLVVCAGMVIQLLRKRRYAR